MDTADKSKEGQIQLLIEYGSQHGQLQVQILEINNLILPAVKRLGISHAYVKSHLLCEKSKDKMKTRSTVKGFFLPNTSKEMKRKTEEVKLTLSYNPASEEANKGSEKRRKSMLLMALQKQRQRFRLKRSSDRVKTVVNTAGDDDDGRATMSFERPLYYPSVSLYQLQTQSLHLTICGRNVTTTRSYPIATTSIPLMIAIKQHHPTWYPLSYNPDLITNMSQPQNDSAITFQDTWEKAEGGTYTGRNLAWDMSETRESSQDNWLHKRKDYSRHLQSKTRRQHGTSQATVGKKNSLPTNQSPRNGPEHMRRSLQPNDERHLAPGIKSLRNHRENPMMQNDSGVDLDKVCVRQDSIEELYFNSVNEASPELDTGKTSNPVFSGGFRKPQKQWTSEFVICSPSMEKKRNSNSNNLNVSSLSLHGSMNRKTFGETIRGF